MSELRRSGGWLVIAMAGAFLFMLPMLKRLSLDMGREANSIFTLGVLYGIMFGVGFLAYSMGNAKKKERLQKEATTKEDRML